MAVKPGVTLQRKDAGLQDLFKILRELPGLQVTVGIQGQDVAQTYPDGTPITVVALANEFGTKDIPSRPFMRRASQEAQRGALKDVTAESLADVVAGSEDPVEALSEVGKELAKAVVQQLDSARSWATPDDPETVEEKQTSSPLTDTGRLRDSISWAVRRDGQVVAKGRP